MTQEELLRLPKVELHCHLDGSLSQEFIQKRLGKSVKKEELSVSDDCTSLAEYLEKFDMPCQCLKDEEGLEEAGYDVLKSMSKHVCYAGDPLCTDSETESMSCKKAMEALIKGLERGKQDFAIEYGVIACAMRHIDEEENWRMIRLQENSWIRVCGADLAGAEASTHVTVHEICLKIQERLVCPLRFMPASAEVWTNITDAVNVGAKRIGHGIAMRGHEDVIRELAEKKSELRCVQ